MRETGVFHDAITGWPSGPRAFGAKLTRIGRPHLPGRGSSGMELAVVFVFEDAAGEFAQGGETSAKILPLKSFKSFERLARPSSAHAGRVFLASQRCMSCGSVAGA